MIENIQNQPILNQGLEKISNEMESSPVQIKVQSAA